MFPLLLSSYSLIQFYSIKMKITLSSVSALDVFKLPCAASVSFHIWKPGLGAQYSHKKPWSLVVSSADYYLSLRSNEVWPKHQKHETWCWTPCSPPRLFFIAYGRMSDWFPAGSSLTFRQCFAFVFGIWLWCTIGCANLWIILYLSINILENLQTFQEISGCRVAGKWLNWWLNTCMKRRWTSDNYPLYTLTCSCSRWNDGECT